MNVKTVYLFANGNVAVFDQNGQQIPKLQGSIFKVMNKIANEADETTEFWMIQRGSIVRMQVAWYFLTKKVEGDLHE